MKQEKKYAINLHLLKGKAEEYDYILDNQFFADLEQEEILGGTVSAKVKIEPKASSFLLSLSVEGEVSVPCDRCLDPVTVNIKNKTDLLVKLAKQISEDDEIIYVDAADGLLQTDWLLYELVELSLPIVCRHPEGECNPEMAKLLQSHLCTTEVPEE